MDFIFNLNTKINSKIDTAPVNNAVKMLERDMKKVFNASTDSSGEIKLIYDASIGCEEYKITAGENIVITASDDLGFVYALLFISEKYLGIKPFWFWLDRKTDK